MNRKTMKIIALLIIVSMIAAPIISLITSVL